MADNTKENRMKLEDRRMNEIKNDLGGSLINPTFCYSAKLKEMDKGQTGKQLYSLLEGTEGPFTEKELLVHNIALLVIQMAGVVDQLGRQAEIMEKQAKVFDQLALRLGMIKPAKIVIPKL